MKRRNLLLSLVGIVAAAVVGTIATVSAGWRPGLALDLQGGASVVLKPLTKNVDTGSLDQAKQIISNRVNGLGVAEAEVVRQGDAIIVSSVNGANADQVTAITLLAGVEAILTKPGTREMSLGDWNKCKTRARRNQFCHAHKHPISWVGPVFDNHIVRRQW